MMQTAVFSPTLLLRRNGRFFFVWLLLLLVGCGPAQQPPLLVTAREVWLEPTAVCSGSFVTHALDHVTTITKPVVAMFESNGAGLAINDLDNDDDLDIVLANLKGPNAIFWNDGGLLFRKELLGHGGSRAVNIVDVDGDGWQDITFSQHTGSVSYWHNGQNGRFAPMPLPGVANPAYAMTWGDLDNDGDLDLVTASYDAALEKELGNSFLLGEGAGLFVYRNDGGQFVAERLAEVAQTLALLLWDVDEDGRLDIVVGNDFAVLDQVWRQTDKGWELAAPFATTTHSTMSFDAADIDNNGRFELLATDMKPYRDDPQTLAAWQPVFEMMMHGEMADDPQVMENVVQRAGSDGFADAAADLGLVATGWSWSAKFGDLNNDGRLDLYVVNGMAAADLFGHLPNNELVEENQVFRQAENGRFLPEPAWHLNSTFGGRGMSLADLDNDGDLDIVVNNLLAPAQLFENQLCEGTALAVDLLAAGSGNGRWLGAKLVLTTSAGTYTRAVRASSGYLSGDPARVHFGLPHGAQLQKLEIYWPDGPISHIDQLKTGTRLIITRR